MCEVYLRGVHVMMTHLETVYGEGGNRNQNKDRGKGMLKLIITEDKQGLARCGVTESRRKILSVV